MRAATAEAEEAKVEGWPGPRWSGGGAAANAFAPSSGLPSWFAASTSSRRSSCFDRSTALSSLLLPLGSSVIRSLVHRWTLSRLDSKF